MSSLAVQFCFNIPKATLHWSKHCAMLFEKLQTTLRRKKVLYNVVLILLEQHWTGKKPYGFFSLRLQTTLHGKKCNAMLSEHCRLNFLLDFLIITGCCKCHTKNVQISPTLRNINPGLTLNKKAGLNRISQSRPLDIYFFHSLYPR